MKQGTALRYSISPGRPMGAISLLPPAIIPCSYGKWTPEKRQRSFPPGRFLVEEKYIAAYCFDATPTTPTTPATLVEEKYYAVYCFDRLLAYLSHAVREGPCRSRHGDESAALVAA